jgi:hypothetical protein
MTPLNSAAVCRHWEAHHRQAAAEARSLNLRNIALTAAAAWGRQAEEAEAYESGIPAELSIEDAAIALEFRREEEFPDESGTDDPGEIADIAPEADTAIEHRER